MVRGASEVARSGSLRRTCRGWPRKRSHGLVRVSGGCQGALFDGQLGSRLKEVWAEAWNARLDDVVPAFTDEVATRPLRNRAGEVWSVSRLRVTGPTHMDGNDGLTNCRAWSRRRNIVHSSSTNSRRPWPSTIKHETVPARGHLAVVEWVIQAI